jgi:adenylate kinase family enzyme
LFHNPDQSQTVLQYLKDMDSPIDQMLIGISTVLTWNRTNTRPNYNPLGHNKTPVLNELNYKKRKCSPRFRGIRQLESLVLATQKDNLFSYVVAPGVLYGRGESDLHLIFRDAWLADQPLKVLGQGSNAIPMIHVEDMVSCVLQLVYAPPTHTQYLVLVDGGRTTQEQLVKTVAKQLGTGAVETVSRQDAELQALVQSLAQEVPALAPAAGLSTQASASNLALSVDDPIAAAEAEAQPLQASTSLAVPRCDGVGSADPDVVLLDMQFALDNAVVAALPVQWRAPGGFVASFAVAHEEFIRHRGLTPVRVLVSGGPGTGKSHYAKLIADRYRLPVVTVAACIAQAAEGSGLLADTIRTYLSESRDGDGKRKPIPRKPAARGQQGSVADTFLSERLPERVVAEAVRRALMQPKARNHGFVLDGFPRTGLEAKLLFKQRKAASQDEYEDADEAPLAEEKEDDRWAEEDGEEEEFEEEEEEERDEEAEEKAQLLDMLREEEAEASAADPALPRRSGASQLRQVGLRAGARRGHADPALRVNHAVFLAAGEDEALRKSRELLPLTSVVPRHNDEEGLRRRWARWRLTQGQWGAAADEGRDARAAPDETGGSVFDWTDVEVLEVSQGLSNDAARCVRVVEAYVNQTHKDGPYFSSPEAYAKQQAAREKMLSEQAARVSEERARKARAMAAERAQRADLAVRMRETARKQEDELVEACSLPIRQFLMKHVVGAVVDGLYDVCNAQPEDPVDHLAEYLFKIAVNSANAE